jgi:hypothetical protein
VWSQSAGRHRPANPSRSPPIEELGIDRRELRLGRRRRVSSKIAATGQTDRHTPQSMHSSGWMCSIRPPV